VLTLERELDLDWVERKAGIRDEEMERNPYLLFCFCVLLQLVVSWKSKFVMPSKSQVFSARH